jgi:hypothetical protein
MHATPQLHIFSKWYEYVKRFTMLNLVFYFTYTQQEVLRGNYVAFKCFCNSMSVEHDTNKESMVLQINNSFMCIIFNNADFDNII